MSPKEAQKERERVVLANELRQYGQPKWIYSTNDWPDQRFNWTKWSLPTKAKLITGYNKQRAKMGYVPIPNPYSPGGPRPAPEYITEPTPGKEKIYMNPKFEGDQYDKHPYNPDMPGSADKRHFFPSVIENMFSKQWEAMSSTEKSLVSDITTFASTTKRGKNILIADGIDPVTGTSGLKRPATDEGDQPDKAQRIDSLKRPAEEQLEEPPTKVPPNTTTSTTSAPTTIGVPKNTTEIDMAPMPGTGSEEVKKGSNFSGGFDSASGPCVYVERPITIYKTGEITFSKVIRVLTYGVAPVFLGTKATAVNYGCITSSLAEIPWDRLFMYMNPGEFASLPPASFAKHAHCEIVQRNPRVAFQTGESTSTLATLNQNKFGVSAIGLNKNKYLRGLNRSYESFASAEPMEPTELKAPNYTGYSNILYGYKQSNAAFDGNVPAQPFMVPVVTKNYWCTLSYTNAATVPDPDDRYNPGWPDLSKYVKQFDMNATAGTKIIDMNYDFNYCPLTQQLPAVDYADLDVSFYAPQPKIAKITMNSDVTSADVLTTSEVNAISINEDNYVFPGSIADIIDKSYCKGDNTRNQGFSRSIMPSIHVGISPVPRITASITGGEIKSWTDVQAYFEVKCTLVVGYHMDHSSTHYGKLHEIVDNIKMGAPDFTTGTTATASVTNPIFQGMWSNNNADFS